MATRPLGIIILLVLTVIIGGLLFFGGFFLTLLAAFVAVMSPELPREIARAIGQVPGVPIPVCSMMVVGTVWAIIGVFVLIIGIITLLVGLGLWAGQNWARWIAIIVFGLGAFSNLIDLLRGQSGPIISLVINGAIVYYLFTPRAKAFFGATV